MLDEDQFPRRFANFGGRAYHVIQPIGMLRGRAIVRSLEFGNVQRVLVAVDDQRHFRNVALVNSVAGDAALSRPSPQMPRELSQPIAKLRRLTFGLLAKSTEGR